MMRNDYKELERITRESTYYPAEKVKDFLKSEVCRLLSKTEHVP
jgi:hypothetical protein